ncbi:hypothetical protein [Peromfec virus RodF8_28]|uniref:Uncharacterized protein n=1 Tax=Peromfec virus RodF8_28 TaxID=2929366 RepID=A0A976N1T7_9VIRU|nr:hypothetical protein [Peromfec virus RodF8_28]
MNDDFFDQYDPGSICPCRSTCIFYQRGDCSGADLLGFGYGCLDNE